MHTATEDYSNYFIKDTPLMDVRAPIEYKRGAFPNAINLPLMDDDQRESVGTYYKLQGKDKAIQRGHELVSGDIREQRIQAWMEFAEQNPCGSLYCFRGGMRSKITQQWMKEAGTHYSIIKGGYKALRSFLINKIETISKKSSFTLVGGKTGSAKTHLIQQLKYGIDLEACAHHRGSSFGRHATEQQTQINFENCLAIQLLKLNRKSVKKITLEDEARTIGRVGIPKVLFEKMRMSSIVVIEEPYDKRLERLINEYVIEMQKEFEKIYGESNGFTEFSNYLLTSLEKIKKRLGPVRYSTIYTTMQNALTQQTNKNDVSKHFDWLRLILDNYYDPMYEDQLNQKKNLICFRGNYAECLDYLQHSF